MRRSRGTARRGKYLWLVLDDRDALLMHLGMSGQMLITSPDAAVAPHERARFSFTDGGCDLRFDDQRTFGHLLYDEGGAVLPSPVVHIARDPFDSQFDQAGAVSRIKARRTGIKRALLDQRLVSGIGNIYADEGLRAAKVRGETALRGVDPCQRVSRARGRATPNFGVRPSTRSSGRARQGTPAAARPSARPSPCRARWTAGDGR